MKESVYCNVFLKSDVSEDMLKLVDEEAWMFFKNNYPSLSEIPRV